MKRIGLLVLTRHIANLGGIGFYVDSFVAAAKGKYIVDIIVDRPIAKDDIPFSFIRECDIIASDKSIGYGASSNFFMFYGEKSFMELGTNVVGAIANAMMTRFYDCLFVNSYEMGVFLGHADFDRILPTVLYTHLGKFYREYPESLDECGSINMGLTLLPHITQVPDKKFDFIKNKQFYVPMVTSEYEFFANIPKQTEKNTAFFNGTFRDIKRPHDFVAFCKKYQKKGLIITNSKGKEFFEKAFAEAGLECEVKTHIFGKEKVEFISRGELMFHPSKNEMMSLAVLEALFYMPVVVYDENWIDMCPPGVLTVIKNISDFESTQIADIDRRQWVMDYFDPKKNMDLFDAVISDLDSFDSKTTSSSLKDVQKIVDRDGGISINDYWKKVKNRNSIILADIVTMYKIARTIGVSQSEHQSFIGVVVEKESSSDDTLDL